METEKLAQLAFIEMYLKVENYNFDRLSTRLLSITLDLVMEWLQEEMTTKYLDKKVSEPLILATVQEKILKLTLNTRLAVILNHMVGSACTRSQ